MSQFFIIDTFHVNNKWKIENYSGVNSIDKIEMKLCCNSYYFKEF